MLQKRFLANASLFLAYTEAIVLPLDPSRGRPRDTLENIASWATFDDVTPSPELKWIDCIGPDRQCAKLTVPLDYENPHVGTTDIAFVRYLFSEDAEDILFNPGGPGSTAVWSAGPMGPGEAWSKRWGYNFVTFDPRGVGQTGPDFFCSPTNTSASPSYSRTNGELGDLVEVWNYKLDYSERCSEANAHTDARYIGTSAVVQDLIHFTELQAAAKGKDPKLASINYFGISYGTIIGQTLAAMYPERLRRVLLNGNVHGPSHYEGWIPNQYDDLSHAIFLFTKLCFEAKGERCALSQGAESIETVERRFEKVVNMLEKQLVEICGRPFGTDDFFQLIQRSLYSPKSFTDIDSHASLILSNETSKLPCSTPTTDKVEQSKSSQNAFLLITAADIAGRYPWRNYEEWKAAADSLYTRNPHFAEFYATRNGLTGLINLIPPTSQIFPGFEQVNTSNPILFVSTSGDPVTPVGSAREMSRLFPGSGMVVVDVPGHPYRDLFSQCGDKIIAEYWNSGDVPAEETWCETSVSAGAYFSGPAVAVNLTLVGE